MHILRRVLPTEAADDAQTCALLLGAARFVCEWEQTHEPSVAHVTTTIWPALASLMLSEHDRAQHVLASFVAATEVAGKIGRVIGPLAAEQGCMRPRSWVWWKQQPPLRVASAHDRRRSQQLPERRYNDRRNWSELRDRGGRIGSWQCRLVRGTDRAPSGDRVLWFSGWDR